MGLRLASSNLLLRIKCLSLNHGTERTCGARILACLPSRADAPGSQCWPSATPPHDVCMRWRRRPTHAGRQATCERLDAARSSPNPFPSRHYGIARHPRIPPRVLEPPSRASRRPECVKLGDDREPRAGRAMCHLMGVRPRGAATLNRMAIGPKARRAPPSEADDPTSAKPVKLHEKREIV